MTLTYAGDPYIAVQMGSAASLYRLSFTGYAYACDGELLKLVRDDDVANVQPFASLDPITIQGPLGVGTTAPTHMLHVVGDLFINGDAVKTTSGNNWTVQSDARLKQNITPLSFAALPRLLRLRGVTYEWREPEKHGNQNRPQIGMIAQEVEQVFPEWVGTDADGYKTLTYRGFEALIVESLRELKNENDRLKAKSERLEAQNADLGHTLAAVDERLAALEKRGGAQRASMLGDERVLGGVMFGAVGALVPWWTRRRRRRQA